MRQYYDVEMEPPMPQPGSIMKPGSTPRATPEARAARARQHRTPVVDDGSFHEVRARNEAEARARRGAPGSVATLTQVGGRPLFTRVKVALEDADTKCSLRRKTRLVGEAIS